MTDHLTEQCGPGVRHRPDEPRPARDPRKSWRRSTPTGAADPETARRHLAELRAMLADPGDQDTGGAA